MHAVRKLKYKTNKLKYKRNMPMFKIYQDKPDKPASARRLFESPPKKRKRSPAKSPRKRKSPSKRKSAGEKAYLKLLGRKSRSKYTRGTLKYKKEMLTGDLNWYTKLLDSMKVNQWNAAKVKGYRRDKKIIQAEAKRVELMQRREDREKKRKRDVLRKMR